MARQDAGYGGGREQRRVDDQPEQRADGEQQHQRDRHADQVRQRNHDADRDQSYSGTTTISAGTLQLGNGGTTGTLGTGAVVNNGGLDVNRSDALTVSNDISGTGTVDQDRHGDDDADRHEHL